MPSSLSNNSTKKTLKAPDFVVIGAQRSGSSWLFTMLRQHPQLWLPPIKELFFFCTLWEGVREKEKYERRRKRLNKQSLVILQELAGVRKKTARSLYPSFDLRFALRYLWADRTLKDYVALFAPAKARGLVCGEITPTYSVLGESSIRTIRSLNPDIKAILTLRDPVERTWSQAMKNLCRAKGLKASDVPAEKYLEYFDEPLVHGLSDYRSMIKRWRAGLAPGNLLIRFYDEIESDPSAFLITILRFLSVDEKELSNFEGMKSLVNAAAKPLGCKMPERIRRHLAERYEPLMRELAWEFGSIPNAWLQRYAVARSVK